jgi:hypothetical protein
VNDQARRSLMRERRLLQIGIGATACFPLVLGFTVAVTGLAGFWILFAQPGSPPDNPSLDSAVRFLGAQFFGLGLIIVWILPKIERRSVPFRIVVFAVVLGGVARVLSHIFVGRPNLLTEILIGIEFAVLGLGLWQTRIARKFRELEDGAFSVSRSGSSA